MPLLSGKQWETVSLFYRFFIKFMHAHSQRKTF